MKGKCGVGSPGSDAIRWRGGVSASQRGAGRGQARGAGWGLYIRPAAKRAGQRTYDGASTERGCGDRPGRRESLVPSGFVRRDCAARVRAVVFSGLLGRGPVCVCRQIHATEVVAHTAVVSFR